MMNFWKDRATTYGRENDLEMIVRRKIVDFVNIISQKEKISVLELGCGNGRLLKMINETCGGQVQITGVDYSSEMINEARNVGINATLINDDVAHFLKVKEGEGEKFDAVIFANTLHNLESKEKIFDALSAAGKVIKPGGYLIFDIRNSLNPFINFGYRKNRRKGLQFFTLSTFEIKKVIKRIGLRLVDCKPIYYDNLVSAGKMNKSMIFKALYSGYLLFTRFTLMSPYILVIARKVRIV